MTRSPQSNFLQHYQPQHPAVSNQMIVIHGEHLMGDIATRYGLSIFIIYHTLNSSISNVLRLTQTTTRNLTLLAGMLVSGCRLPP